MEWTNQPQALLLHGRHTLHKVATLQAMGLLGTMAASIELTATPAPPLALKCAKWRTAGDWAAEQKRFLSLRKGGMTARAHKLAIKALRERAASRAADLAPVIAELQTSGATSLRAIAAGLNAKGIATPRGSGEWSATQVKRTAGNAASPKCASYVCHET